MSGSIINKILGFIVLLLIANYLGPENYGKFTYAFALVTFFIFLSDFGIPNLTIRQVVRKKKLANKYLMNSLMLRFLLAALSVLLIFIIINLIENSRDIIFLVLIISFTLIFNSINNCFESTNSAFEKMEINALLSNLKNILIFLGILLAIFLKQGLLSLALIYLIVSGIIALINYLIVKKKIIKPHWELDFSFWKYLLFHGWPFALTGIFFTIYFKIDTIMLKLIKGSQEVGYYNAAFNLVFALSFIPVSITNALFPRMSEYFATAKETLRHAFQLAIRRIFTLSLPIVIGGFILAEPIINLLYRNKYSPSIIAFQILIVTIIFAWANMGMTILLNSIDRQIIPTKITAIGVLINIGLNIILIPKYGFIGASFATLFTEIILAVLCYFSVKRYFPFKYSWKNFARLLIAVLPCGIIAYLFKNAPIIVPIVLCCIIYFSILFFLKEFSEKEKELIKIMLKR
jgi:O-antigen/teichoic acid export membrane protein